MTNRKGATKCDHYSLDGDCDISRTGECEYRYTINCPFIKAERQSKYKARRENGRNTR